MKELKEIRFSDNPVQLNDNLVKGAILPEKAAELSRVIVIQGNTVIEGPVYAHKLEIQNGDLEIQGAVFTHQELYVNSEASGVVRFKKSVGSANAVVARTNHCQTFFYADINAKSITLYNAFVAGSIYADEVILENCVVTGGVFATQSADLTNVMAGTFNAPFVRIAQSVGILLPSAFSVEKISVAPETAFYNLSLADLGALYKGRKQAPDSGKIMIDVHADTVQTTLATQEMQTTLHSYTVTGKILAADLIDTDKFQHHFLLTAAALGAQLLKTYDLGVNDAGEAIPLTIEKIRDFFFDILHGKIDVQTLDGVFRVAQITAKL
jgi:hypothetical protein